MSTPQEKTKVKDILSSIVTPSLVVLLGWFAKSELDYIKSELKLVRTMEVNQRVESVRVDNLERSLKDFKLEVKEKLAAKHEEEIRIPKRRGT